MKTFNYFFCSSFIALIFSICPIYAQKSTTPILIEHPRENTLDTYTVKSFYANGSVKEIKNVCNGRLQGSWSFYYENGKLMKKGNFINDRAEGTWKKYDKMGNLVRIENYKEGLEHGVWIEYHSNGLLKTKGEFENGYRENEWITYSYTGRKKTIFVFYHDTVINTIDPKNEVFFSTSDLAGNL